jgi:hypothetical protein
MGDVFGLCAADFRQALDNSLDTGRVNQVLV